MPSYLLPCTCGQNTVVSTAEAGQNVRCTCGARLEVPSMRKLHALAPAEPAALSRSARSRAAWSNLHRLAFVLFLAVLGCLALVGYLALQLPPAPWAPSPQDVDHWLQTSTPSQTVDLFEDLKTGIEPATIDPGAVSRRAILWGIALASVVGACSLVAAVIVLAKARKS